jgi:hypothetical protein
MNRLPLFLLCAGVSALAAAPAKPKPQKASSAAELDACVKHIETRNRCLEQFCQMEAEVTVATVKKDIPQAPPMDAARVKKSCLASMGRQNQTPEARMGVCQQVAASGHLAEMLKTTRTCDAKKSCAAQVACLKPSLEAQLHNALKMHSQQEHAAMGPTHDGATSPHGGAMSPHQGLGSMPKHPDIGSLSPHPDFKSASPHGQPK